MNQLRRTGLWVVAGIAILSAVVLKDISGLIAAVEDAGKRSYSADVFTGPKIIPTNVDDLDNAIELWRTAAVPDASRRQFDVLRLLRCHVAIDGLLFLPTYAVLIAVLLSFLGAPPNFTRLSVLAIIGSDGLETLWTYYVLVARQLQPAPDWWLVAIQVLALLKWMVLAGVAVAGFAYWTNPEVGHRQASVTATLRHLRDSRRGKASPAPLALGRQFTLVAAFAALVALPAGGPLDQFPDVIRHQIAEMGATKVWLVSLAALLLLSLAMATSGLISTNPRHNEAPAPTLRSWRVLGAFSALSGALISIASCVDGGFRWTPVAFVLVAAGVLLAAGVVWLAEWLAPVAKEEEKGGVKVAVSVSPCTKADSDASNATPSADNPVRRGLWVGALAGIVIIAGGVGIIRAVVPVIVLESPVDAIWWRAAICGAAMSLLGGVLAQAVAVPWCRLIDEKRSAKRRVVGLTIGAASVVAVALVAYRLVRWPDDAHEFGTIGVVAAGFSLLSLFVGALTWLSRCLPGWRATHTLGFGVRTPWLALVIVSWMLASVFNTDGVYHDVHVEAGREPYRYEDLKDGFDKWLEAQKACSGDALPMVFVAAPGGGIRAAYWTAATLDRLFGLDECGSRRLFAVSAVSGSSLGVATWVASRDKKEKESGESNAGKLSEDRGLASAAAALLFRDLYQPFTGMTGSWRNRARLLEDGWSATEVFKRGDRDLRWSEVGATLKWAPLMVLNGSSVTDGCRILVTNVGALPAGIAPDCLGGMTTGGPLARVTGAIDPLADLEMRGSNDPGCSAQEAGVNAITAVLLSARFPVISPSGALIRCLQTKDRTTGAAVSRRRITYAVDGGYYENSGLLTLLQMWSALEPHVRHYNEAVRSDQPPIVPWVVVLDNSYRSVAEVRSPSRPFELVVPLRTVTNNQALRQAALEQMARVALENRVAIVAPRRQPTVAAPLGWVLSKVTRAGLAGEAALQLGPSPPTNLEPGLADLRAQLGLSFPRVK